LLKGGGGLYLFTALDLAGVAIQDVRQHDR
jgi:hypothetical protein